MINKLHERKLFGKQNQFKMRGQGVDQTYTLALLYQQKTMAKISFQQILPPMMHRTMETNGDPRGLIIKGSFYRHDVIKRLAGFSSFQFVAGCNKHQGGDKKEGLHTTKKEIKKQ